MKPSEILNSPDKWIKGHTAETARGETISPLSEAACKFCLLGAIDRAFFNGTNGDYLCFRGVLAEKVSENTIYSDIADFNDAPETTFAEVREILLETEKEFYTRY